MKILFALMLGLGTLAIGSILFLRSPASIKKESPLPPQSARTKNQSDCENAQRYQQLASQAYAQYSYHIQQSQPDLDPSSPAENYFRLFQNYQAQTRHYKKLCSSSKNSE